MKKILLYIALLSFVSCDAWHEKLIGNYHLSAMDSRDDMRITYYDKALDLDISITESGVYEVGHDDDFILAKAYKTLKDSLGSSLYRYDKEITEYYIIPVDNTQGGWEAQQNSFKLLTEEEFESKRKELGVSDDITFNSL